MTEKSKFSKRIPIICRTLMTASLCAGLLLSACGSKAAQEQPGSDSAAAAASTAEMAETAVTAGTAAQAADTAVTAESAAAATTGAQFADPDWSPDKSEEKTFSAMGKGLVIVLDPGHTSQVSGLTEPVGPGSAEMKEEDTVGTFGPSSGLHEYELTMNVAQKARAELEERGYEVKMTHHDTFNPISCSQRAAVANENNADAFIRIHANGSDDVEAQGAMTICITEDNPYHPELYKASARLSDILLDTYCTQTGARREYVWETDTMTGNNWAEMPTTMIELGYMTNPDEDLRMNQDSYQKEMANAIADALDKWFAEMPEEELSMHPSLKGEKEEGSDSSSGDSSADDSSSGDSASDDSVSDDNSSGDNASGETDDGSASDGQESNDESASDGQESGAVPAAPAAATPAGTSSGNGTGVSTDPGSAAE